MIDLSTTYLGLKLKNPIIVASSGLTDSVESIKDCENNNAAAVVLKSIFEEEILAEAAKTSREMMQHHYLRESFDYIDHHIKGENLGRYIKLIKDAKRETNIPIIASINCVSNNEWLYFAKQIEAAGADALELNMFILPSNFDAKGSEDNQLYLDVAARVTKELNIPVAMKISHYFSNLAYSVKQISETDIKGIVLFNRFYSPDIDIDNFKVLTSSILSNSNEQKLPLRWIAILAHRVNCDLAASTGIHDGRSAIKMLLAGAKAVQIASALYKNGKPYINSILDEIRAWMAEHNFQSTNDFIGKMSQKEVDNPAAYERVQFMKYFSGIS